MVSPPPPPPSSEDLCCGPVLIIHGGGLESEDTARKIEQQCTRLGLRSRGRAIDACSDVELSRFPCLVLVLPTPSAPVNVRLALEPFAALAATYRGRWPHGLSSVVAGQVEAMDAGVLHLYGEEALLHNPTLRTAYKRACYVQATDVDPAVELLRPYTGRVDLTGRPAPWEGTADVAADLIEQTWRYVQTWGASDIATVPALLACIERCRAHFDDETYPALHRPDPRHAKNRLDFVLDAPGVGPDTAKARKAWTENGARVVRHVRKELEKVAGLRRPGSVEAPGAQRDLRDLYESLKILDAHRRASS